MEILSYKIKKKNDKIVKLCPADQGASTVSLTLSLAFLRILGANLVQPCNGGELSKLLFRDSIFIYKLMLNAHLHRRVCLLVSQ